MKRKHAIEVEDGSELDSRMLGVGRPRARRTARLSIHAGIEKVLYKAAIEPGFRRDLLEDRLAAIRTRGIVLTAAEQAILASVPQARLDLMIDRIRPDKHGKRRFMKAIAAAVVTLASGTATVSCTAQPAGVEPDVPEDVPVDTSHPDPLGDAPDIPEDVPDVMVDTDEMDIVGGEAPDIPEPDLDDDHDDEDSELEGDTDDEDALEDGVEDEDPPGDGREEG